MTLAIAVHGGAGPDRVEECNARRTGVECAADAGMAVLERGGSALDAVVAAVIVLENDPVFNAGLGSVLTDDGVVELDASVMTGDSLAAGAVGAVRGVPNPILLAQAILLEGREVMLTGDAAEAAAARAGIPTCAPEALITEAARRRWRERAAAPGGTVGAVARDRLGHVAAATSTGGLAGKRRGRIGDSAVIGAGTYADDLLGAGSATGPGEAIIRVALVRTALEHVARGDEPAAAARDALEALRTRLAVMAGVILVSPDGLVGIAHTTESMPSAVRIGRATP